MKRGMPRTGTCITATDSYCALIGKNLYLKILKKLQDEQNLKMIAFLRQYELLKAWSTKELLFFSAYMNLKNIQHPNTIIFEEGRIAENFVIIKSGEFDVVKTKLSHVKMNLISGRVVAQLSDGKNIYSSVQKDQELPQSGQEDHRS